jgi:K+-transporting ATPase KdpF subunit
MNGMYWFTGFLAVSLFLYLIYALLKAERL